MCPTWLHVAQQNVGKPSPPQWSDSSGVPCVWFGVQRGVYHMQGAPDGLLRGGLGFPDAAEQHAAKGARAATTETAAALALVAMLLPKPKSALEFPPRIIGKQPQYWLLNSMPA